MDKNKISGHEYFVVAVLAAILFYIFLKILFF